MEPSDMSGRTRQSYPGILIARAWREPGGAGSVHVRLMWTADVIGGGWSAAPRTVVVDSREALLAVVADWFAQITCATRQPDPDST
jgi:hypothetical protein